MVTFKVNTPPLSRLKDQPFSPIIRKKKVCSLAPRLRTHDHEDRENPTRKNAKKYKKIGFNVTSNNLSAVR